MFFYSKVCSDLSWRNLEITNYLFEVKPDRLDIQNMWILGVHPSFWLALLILNYSYTASQHYRYQLSRPGVTLVKCVIVYLHSNLQLWAKPHICGWGSGRGAVPRPADNFSQMVVHFTNGKKRKPSLLFKVSGGVCTCFSVCALWQLLRENERKA